MSEEDIKHLIGYIDFVITHYDDLVLSLDTGLEIEKCIKYLQHQLEEKENIIKEVKEFIYKCNDGKQGINYSGCSKLLDILDKGE